MKVNTVKVPYDTVRLLCFSDLHIGSPKCDLNKIKNQIAEVANSANTYAVLLGDIVDNATKTSIGDTYSETLAPTDQIANAVELFKPIKDKIVGVCTGNHEKRSYKKEGVDLTKLFALSLGLEDVYSPAGFVALFKLPRKTYAGYFAHGEGCGGRLIGSKANGLQRRKDVVTCDFYVCGHTHQPMVFKTAYYEVDKRHSTVNLQEQLFVNLPAFLDYEAYAETIGLPPSNKTMPCIVMSCVGRKDKELYATL